MNKPLWPFTKNPRSPQAAGLVLWVPGQWDAGNCFDLSGRHHNGTINGTVPATGVKGAGLDGGKQAVVFDGGTTRVDFGNQTDFQVTSGVSVSCWVNTVNTGYNYICVKWGSAGGTDSFHLRIDATTGFAYWNCSTTGSYQAANDCIGTTNVADGKWHLVTGTYDGTNLKVYVDSVLQTTLAATGGGGNVFNTSSSVSWGGLSDASATTNWFLGSMEDLKVHNTAINAAVVEDMYRVRTRWNLRAKPISFLIVKTTSIPVDQQDGWEASPSKSAWSTPLAFTSDEVGSSLVNFGLDQEQAWDASKRTDVWNPKPFTDDDAIQGPNTINVEQEDGWSASYVQAVWNPKDFLSDEIGASLVNFSLDQEEVWQQAYTVSPWSALPFSDEDVYPTPPPVVPGLSTTPEVRIGPIPGSPFFRLMPSPTSPTATTVVASVPNSFPGPQVFSGPPRPGSPWFSLQNSITRPISTTNAIPPDIVVVQKVVVQSRASVNPGVLVSGRRPDRPGS